MTQLRYEYNLPGQSANRLLNIELGLFLLAELMPMAPAEALPNLLNGGGGAYDERPIWKPRQYRYLSRARTLLAPYRSRTLWMAALQKYSQLPASMRAYNLAGLGGWAPEMGGSTLRKREDVFRKALG